MFDRAETAEQQVLLEEDPAAVRARLGLALPEDGGAPQAIIERLLQLSDFARLMNLSADELVETAAAFTAVEAWAAAGARAAAARLHTRLGSTAAERPRPGRIEACGAAADELAMRLGVSRQRAARLVGEGRAYEGVLHPVGTALAGGHLDAGKAAVFAELLAEQPAPVCFAVCEQVLPAAPGLTHHALRKRVRAVIIQVDPTTAHQRATLAATTRRLEHLHLLPDGMASLRLVAPVLDVATVYTAAESAARAQRATGDPRTLDQLRADALTTLAAHALTAGSLRPDAAGGPPVSDASRPSRCEAIGPTVLPATACDEFDLLRLQDQAAEDDVSPLGLARATVRSATRSLSPSTRTRRRHLRRSGKGVEPPSLALDLLGRPLDGARPARSAEDPVNAFGTPNAAGPPSSTGPLDAAAPTSAADPPTDDRHIDGFRSFSGTTSGLVIAAAADHLREPAPEDVQPADPWSWDLAQSVLTDERDDPYLAYEAPTTCRPGIDVPEILGFGPLDPATLRNLATDPPRWLTVTTLPADTADAAGTAGTAGTGGTAGAADGTDGADGTPDAVGHAGSPPPDPSRASGGPASAPATRSYSPGAQLARLVRVLHPTCIAPACTVPSSACDLDHVVAWPLGATAADNLRPLCRHHHVLKTHHNHRYDVTDDGSTLWVTPTGYAHRRPAGGDSQLTRAPRALRFPGATPEGRVEQESPTLTPPGNAA